MPRLRRYSRSSIESLENRIVPAVTIQAGVDLDADGNADDLKIVGGNEHTKVLISDEGNGAGSMVLSVDINGDGDYTDTGEVNGLVINIADDRCVVDLQMGGGNDQVVYQLGGNLNISNRHLSIDLGSGNDAFAFVGIGYSTSGSMLMIDLLAGSGNDEFVMVPPNMSNSEILIDAVMGAGNDQVSQQTGGGVLTIDADAYLDVNIDLGEGANTAAMLLAVELGTTTKGNANYDIIGGSGVDKVSFYNSLEIGNGVLNSNLIVSAELAGGHDEFSFTSLLLNIDSDSTLSVHTSGGSGNDKLGVGYVDSTVTNLKGLAQYDLLGGLGNDQLVGFFLGDSAVGTLHLTGQLRLNLLGQEGNDELLAALVTTGTSNGNFSLLASGGAGSDKVAVFLDTHGATLSYGKYGRMTVDGGQGKDTLDNKATPAGLVDAKFFETFI